MDPLLTVARELPRDFPAAIFLVIHTPRESTGGLSEILNRNGMLSATLVSEELEVVRGKIYVAAPDRHLLLHENKAQSFEGPRENGFRPAIDPLFRSAASFYGRRVIGVVLSGAMDDGVFGLMAIKEAGGVAIVQHPYEAPVPSMPLTAIQNVEVDHIVPAREIPVLLNSLTREEISPLAPSRPAASPSIPTRDIEMTSVPPEEVAGEPSYFTCPECGGSLWQVEQGGLFRYRCHTGHGFTPNTLLSEQNEKLEKALWQATRVLKERAAIHRKLAEQARHRKLENFIDRYEERARAEDAHSRVLEQLLRQQARETQDVNTDWSLKEQSD